MVKLYCKALLEKTTLYKSADGRFQVMYALVVKDPLLIEWQAAGIKEAMKKADQSLETDKKQDYQNIHLLYSISFELFQLNCFT